ncbi:MAG: cytochrome c, partial [Gammaproteobacteria bacterium]|nr:cytochrome c [Gammaproteobacteria bacterium]
MKKVQSWKKVSTVAGGVLLALGMQTAQAQDDEVTYNTHVAKILNENCVVCHQEGGIGPMQLSTFEQVRPWAPLIQLRVAQREMPPYAYDHGIGIQDLQAGWRLDQEEIDTVVAWVN